MRANGIVFRGKRQGCWLAGSWGEPGREWCANINVPVRESSRRDSRGYMFKARSVIFDTLLFNDIISFTVPESKEAVCYERLIIRKK